MPCWIIFNGIIEFRSADSKFDQAVLVGTSRSVRVGIRFQNALLNRALEALPFLVRRFALHPPEYYRSVTACTPVLGAQAPAAFLIQR